MKENLEKIYKKKFIIDKNTCSIFFENLILQNNKVLDFQDPIYDFKTIKGKKEIRNIKQAHIYDGVALTKYLLWLKRNFDKKNLLKLVLLINCMSLEKK